MRRRLLLAFGSILAVGFGVLVVLDVGSLLLAPANQQRHIQGDFVAAASTAGVGGTVDLTEVVPIAWDTVYIWGGYGADRTHQVFPEVDFGDGGYGVDYVIAFADRGNLTAWVRFNVNDPLVYFDPPADGFKVARQDAKFVVSTEPDLPGRFMLTPVP